MFCLSDFIQWIEKDATVFIAADTLPAPRENVARAFELVFPALALSLFPPVVHFFVSQSKQSAGVIVNMKECISPNP